MDFGLDTIVYIVLGLIFVVAQAARKKKAAERIKSPNDETYEEETERPPPSVIQEFLDLNEKDGFQEEYVQKPVDNRVTPKEEVAALSFHESVQYEQNDFEMKDLDREEELVDMTERDLIEKPSSTDEGSGFNLKDAVIYSTILERKYF